MYAFTSKSLISKFVLFVATVALMFSLSSCPGNSMTPTEELTEGERWSKVPTSNHWGPRANFQALLLNNNDVLVMGGHDGSYHRNYINDIWLSSDQGRSWSNITPTNHWSHRHSFQAVMLTNGDVLVMGGTGANGGTLNDIWLSSDQGRSWSNITPANHWGVRSDFQALVLENNDILVMGGQSVDDSAPFNTCKFDWQSKYRNDIWLSKDSGRSWSQISVSNHWSLRHSFQALLYNGDILVIGGDICAVPSGAVYSSADGGTNWSLISKNGWFSPTEYTRIGKRYFQSLILNNEILLLGGFGIHSTQYGVESSIDGGVNWTNLSSIYPDYPATHSFQALCLENNDVLFMGGYSRGNINNNIWLRKFQ